jgi:hypothetical protein
MPTHQWAGFHHLSDLDMGSQHKGDCDSIAIKLAAECAETDGLADECADNGDRPLRRSQLPPRTRPVEQLRVAGETQGRYCLLS